jgi:hypothetical protein
MKTQESKMEDGRTVGTARSVLECGGCDAAFKTMTRSTLTDKAPVAGESGVALRLPPQSKTWRRLAVALFCCFILLSAFGLSVSHAQNYSIDWYKVSGGGGTSSGGSYSVSGTIGQHDATANGALTGGNYSLTGGFWALISVVQTPGAPTLYISHSGNMVTVYWQEVSGWSLQQNSDLSATANWSPGGSPTLLNGTNYLNVIPPTETLFFRLQHP